MFKMRVFLFLFMIFIFMLTCLYILLVSEDSFLCKQYLLTITLCGKMKLAHKSFISLSRKYIKESLARVAYIVKPKLNITVQDGIQNIKWMDTSEDRNYFDYGDNTCGDNPNRNILTKIFKRWIEIATKNNITYFLTCGTLLGAWRNADVIPYDTDLDIIIDGEDNVKLEAIKDSRRSMSDDKFHLILEEDWKLPYSKRRRFNCDGKLVPVYSDECSFQEPLGRLIKEGRHLDIYDFKLENGKLYDPSEWKKEFQAVDVFPLKKCKFMGLETFCPKHPLSILHEFYGKDMNKLRPNTKCRNKKWV